MALSAWNDSTNLAVAIPVHRHAERSGTRQGEQRLRRSRPKFRFDRYRKVDGAGSSWTNSSDLVVGGSGAGTLTIRNGGKVSNVTGGLGIYTGSTGTVTVDGVGSSWTNSGDLSVGNSGTGTLTIRKRRHGEHNTAISVTIRLDRNRDG